MNLKEYGQRELIRLTHQDMLEEAKERYGNEFGTEHAVEYLSQRLAIMETDVINHYYALKHTEGALRGIAKFVNHLSDRLDKGFNLVRDLLDNLSGRQEAIAKIVDGIVIYLRRTL